MVTAGRVSEPAAAAASAEEASTKRAASKRATTAKAAAAATQNDGRNAAAQSVVLVFVFVLFVATARTTERGADAPMRAVPHSDALPFHHLQVGFFALRATGLAACHKHDHNKKEYAAEYHGQ